MTLQQTSNLPLADNYAVNVQIRIQPQGREYKAYIQTDYSDWYSFPLQLTQHDLKALNTELQHMMEQVSDTFDINSTSVVEHHAAKLRTLAKKGNFAFKKIFSKEIIRDLIREALHEGIVIQVTSEDFFLPWELLYDGPIGDQIDASCFWGMRHIISRTLIREARPGDFSTSIISSRPNIGVIACTELESVVKREIPTLERFQTQGLIHLLHLRSLDPSQRDKELVDFGQFLGRDLQIIHLACHAYKSERISESYLLISKDFTISMEDFTIQDFEIKHKPLVLLNTCLSGTISPLHTSNWAVLFWRLGARGVVATEFHVPDWFAASFIEEVYNLLLSKKPIGEALLTARRHFWNQQNNPLGLGYALYSRPSIRIAN